LPPNSDRESRHLHRGMSALPPKADVCSAASDVRYLPIADIREARFLSELALTKCPGKAAIGHLQRNPNSPQAPIGEFGPL
jgi:hypothetical protein